MSSERPIAQLAVIGGSGFYKMPGLSEVERWRPTTPFGDTSDEIVIGSLHGKRVAFLPRHGVGHRLMPHEIPVRANIWALKALGVQGILAVSAVGSLKQEIVPGHMVVPDLPETFSGPHPLSSIHDPPCKTKAPGFYGSGFLWCSS